MVKMSEEEFLALNGVSFATSGCVLDKCRLPHGETARQQKKRLRMIQETEEAYAHKRDEKKAEYRALVESGEIVPKTRQELVLETAAYGHPDNQSTQAARRICDKRGWNWRGLTSQATCNDNAKKGK